MPIAEVNANDSVTTRYVGNYFTRDGNTYRLVKDQIGSVRLVVNAQTGEVAQRIDYDEFGNIVLDTNSDFTPFAFAGGLYDNDTHLVHFGARDYDAKCGRWVSKDPIGFNGGDLNLYSYVSNDPINSTDVTGTFIGATDNRSIQQSQQISATYISQAGQLGNAWVDMVREVAIGCGMVALAVALPGDQTDEMEEQDNNPWVVRGGAMSPENDYFRIDPPDDISPTYGFSVQYKPGTSLKRLVVPHLSEKYNKISVTTKGWVQILKKAFPEVDVIETPNVNRGNPYHGTFVTNSKDYYNSAMKAAIASIFQTVDLRKKWK